MEARHWGSTEIVLTDGDIRRILRLGFMSVQGGLTGPDSRTFVFFDDPTGTAEIDRYGNLTVYVDNRLPNSLPLVIPQSKITPPLGASRERVADFYGESGTITVRREG
jgi:hypothetical protein